MFCSFAIAHKLPTFLRNPFVFFTNSRRAIISPKTCLKQNKNMTTTDFLTGTVKKISDVL